MDYRCPACESKLFEASSTVPVAIEIKCPACSEVVEPDATRPVLHRTYRCTNDGCGRLMHVERPTHDRSYCAVCGTDSLVVADETRRGVRHAQGEGRIQFAGVRTRQ